MHDSLMNEFGGSLGIREEGALASALMRPQLGYYDGLLQEAAAFMESLANDHPFVDGNKRVAFFVTDTFMRMNGHFIACESEAAYTFFMHLFEAGQVYGPRIFRVKLRRQFAVVVPTDPAGLAYWLPPMCNATALSVRPTRHWEGV